MVEVLTPELEFGRYIYGTGTDGAQVRKLIWIEDGFNPEDLFEPGDQGAVFDINNLTTLFQEEDGTVPAVIDQPVGYAGDLSGLSHNAIQATIGLRPFLRNDGTRYYLEFDGVDDALNTSAINFTASDKMTVVIGLRVVGTGNQEPIKLNTISAGSFITLFLASAAPEFRGSLLGSSGPAQIKVTGDTANTVNRVYTFLFDIAGATAADEIHIRKDGTLPTQTLVAAGPAGTGNFGNYAINMGGTIFRFVGRIYRIIVIDKTLSGDDLTNAETWCNGGTAF